MTAGVRLSLRDLTSADAARIADITRATGVFREEELGIAAEVFRDCVAAAGPTGGELALGVGLAEPRPYYAIGAEVDGVLSGWICWGNTPCTENTWDLYWMAVDPRIQGAGIGTALIEEMERRLRGRARLVSIDTSGRTDYAATRRFYEARGYRAVAVVPNFYAPGDDQVIYTKELGE